MSHITVARRSLLACAALLSVVTTSPANAGELLQVQSRPGVTQAAWLDAPSGMPAWVIVLFAGGDGGTRLEAGGPSRMKDSFLLRTADYWASHGEAAVIFDAPSDQDGDMPDRFRLSDAAQQDVAALVTHLHQRFPGARIALLGTSRGTITVGNVLKRSPALADAYVLTSPVTVAKGRQIGLSDIRWEGNTARVLVLSNQHDGCDVAPFANARAMAEQNHFNFIAVSSTAGDAKPDAQCRARAPHGYLGIEPEVLDDIDHWLHGG
jgi:hypothetical protein